MSVIALEHIKTSDKWQIPNPPIQIPWARAYFKILQIEESSIFHNTPADSEAASHKWALLLWSRIYTGPQIMSFYYNIDEML